MIYVISDLHGYPHEQFLQLLEKAEFCSEDFLYVLGDVIDRNGDGGVETLCWLMKQPNAQLILGNHEAMLLSCDFLFEEITHESIQNMSQQKIDLLSNYLANGGEVTILALRKLPRDYQQAVLEYLREAPLYEAVTVGGKDYLLVHAGLGNFSPDKKLSEYTPDELFWESPKREDVYFPDVTTVFGHTPTLVYGDMYKRNIIQTDTWIDIDVGAGFGAEAVLLRLDDMELFSN